MTNPTKGPYTLGGQPEEDIAGVKVPGLIFRDNDGTLAIMAPETGEHAGPNDRQRIGSVNPISFRPKRGEGYRMKLEDDPEQAAVAGLFMAAPVLWENRAEIITGLNMMVNASTGHSLEEWKRVRDEVYAALASVTGEKPADSVSFHRLSLAEVQGLK